MAMQLRKAERKQAKLRIGITGPSGSGKTMSGLLMAYGLVGDWEKVALIDTENGSGELYSHLGDYQVLTLRAPFAPERYIEAIKTCEEAGVEAIVIDSVSHEWDGVGGVLEEADRMGNNIQKWAKLTPRHRRFLEAILQSPCHVITTARKKQDWAISNEGGKNTVQKLGLKEVQREGYEYELTLNLDVDMAHYATASKDRTGLFAGKPDFIITEETGQMLRDWADSGKEDPMLLKRLIIRELDRLGVPDTKDRQMVVSCITNNTGLDVTKEENLKPILEKLKATKILKENMPKEPEAPATPPQTTPDPVEPGVDEDTTSPNEDSEEEPVI